MTDVAPIPPSHRPAVIGPYRPNWLEKPSSDDLSDYYPEHATRMGISGHATIACKVMGDGRLNACVVTDEAPKGEHFGEAALRLSTKFRMIPSDDPSGPPGEVTVPLIFGAPPPSKIMTQKPLTPADARTMAHVGFGVAAVAAVLLAGLIVVLSRYHQRAARRSIGRSTRKP